MSWPPQPVRFEFDDRSLVPIADLEARGAEFATLHMPDGRVLLVPLKQPDSR